MALAAEEVDAPVAPLLEAPIFLPPYLTRLVEPEIAFPFTVPFEF